MPQSVLVLYISNACLLTCRFTNFYHARFKVEWLICECRAAAFMGMINVP